MGIYMPGMNGIELGNKLERLHPRLKLIYMSGNPLSREKLKADSVFLAKPFSEEVLLSAVQQALQGTCRSAKSQEVGSKAVMIRLGRLLFLVLWFPINFVLMVVALILRVFQAVAGCVCDLLREIVFFPDRIPGVGWKMLFTALLFPINIVLVPIHLTLRTFHTLAGMARILLREPAKMSKQISVIGVSGHIRYLFGFYVFMARDFVPNLKNSWKMAFEGKTWRINVTKTQN